MFLRFKLGNILGLLATLILILLFIPSAAVSQQLTATEVMQNVDNLDDGDTSTSEMTMILIDRKGNQRVRQMWGFRKDYGKDKKSMNFFISPADVRNVAFLSYDWHDEDKEDDSWLYLPAIGKPKRISAGNKKDSFMGSDFTYADMNDQEIKDWDYKFVKESEMVDGKDCWVIEGTPKKAKRKKVIDETGYLKVVSWVRKDAFFIVKGKMYVKKGKKIKYLSVSGLDKIQGIWTAKKLTMVTTKRKRKEHSTVLLFNKMIYNKGVDDKMFTVQRMERGL